MVVRLLSRIPAILCVIIAWVATISALPNQWNILLSWPLLAIGQLVCVVFHEFGHAVGAWLGRWKVIVFAVGSLAIQIPNRNIGILSREKRDERAGWVLAIPPEKSLATRRRALLLTAGGPAANLVLASFATVLGWLLPVLANSPDVNASRLLFGLAWLSLAMFFANAIPDGMPRANDGAKILRYLRPKNRSHDITPFQWIMALLGVNVRLRALPPWMVAEALAQSEDSEKPMMATIAIGQALDAVNPDRVEMRRLMDDFHACYPSSHWSTACDAFLAAVYENDVDRAKSALSRVSGTSDIPQLTLAAWAAVAMREGRVGDATRDLKEMDRIVRNASAFSDLTYRDIRRTVESLSANVGPSNSRAFEQPQLNA